MTVVTEDERERVKQAIAKQKRPTITVLSSLLAAQDELGYLPDEAIEAVADLTGASINEVWGVATFYQNFRFSQPGEHELEICWGPVCHLLGATRIITKVQEHLGLSGEGETTDRKVTLRYNTCLGACSQAPVVSIDHHLYGRTTPEQFVELVDAAR